MKFIEGNDRNQISLIPTSLNAAIDQDNEVRIIDLFVDSLDLKEMKFRLDFGENGRPAYHPSDLLKLYMYGYLNKVRSSRDLEKECHRNLEVIWLLKSLSPDHNTISNFRRDNKKAIKNVFKATVQIAKNFDLIGGKLIAGDSTKMRAQNSKKNNYNEKKIKRHIQHIDKKLSQYNEQLAQADGDNKEVIQQKIDDYNKRKDNYHKLSDKLIKTGQTQISTSDPDSRNIMMRNHISEVAYSVQTTVDAKHNIPIDYKLTNTNDTRAMGSMLSRAVEILENNKFTAVYDKGYHNGKELKRADKMGVKTIVAIPDLASSSRAPDKNYNVQFFSYSEKNDTYTCPEGETLTSFGSWYQNNNAKFKQYKTKACLSCVAKSKCTIAKKGKVISRSEYQPYYQKNKKLNEQYRDLYKQRQAIVEHPYGTIKRQWGFSYIITKRGIDKAAADVGLMFTAYNLKRLINIIGKETFTKYLRILSLWVLTLKRLLKAKIKRFKAPEIHSEIIIVFSAISVNQLKFTT